MVTNITHSFDPSALLISIPLETSVLYQNSAFFYLYEHFFKLYYSLFLYYSLYIIVYAYKNFKNDLVSELILILV